MNEQERDKLVIEATHQEGDSLWVCPFCDGHFNADYINKQCLNCGSEMSWLEDYIERMKE